MAKNLDKYIQAYILRKQGKTLKEIGLLMGFSPERARTLINYTKFIMRKKSKDYIYITSMLRRLS